MLLMYFVVSCTFVRELGDNLENMLIGQAASWQCKVRRTRHTTKQSKSFPSLDILAESSLMESLRWTYKTGMDKTMRSSNA